LQIICILFCDKYRSWNVILLSTNNGRLQAILIQAQAEITKIRAEQEQFQQQAQYTQAINQPMPLSQLVNITNPANLPTQPIGSTGIIIPQQSRTIDNTTLALSGLPFSHRRYFPKQA
jgi:hypothetical protein